MTEQAVAEVVTTEVVKPAKAAKAEKKVKTVKQKISIFSADPITLMVKFQECILKGARVDPTEYMYLRSMPMRIGVYVEGPADKDDWMWKSDAWLNCFGIDVAEFTYDAKTLEDLSWEDFRKVCAAVGVKGRDRAKMTKEYLAAMAE